MHARLSDDLLEAVVNDRRDRINLAGRLARVRGTNVDVAESAERRLCAKDELCPAIASGKPAWIEAACRVAERAGVDSGDIEAAKKIAVRIRAQEEKKQLAKVAREARQEPLWASLRLREVAPWRSSTAPASARKAYQEDVRARAVAASASNQITHPIVDIAVASARMNQVPTDFGRANQLQLRAPDHYAHLHRRLAYDVWAASASKKQQRIDAALADARAAEVDGFSSSDVDLVLRCCAREHLRSAASRRTERGFEKKFDSASRVAELVGIASDAS